MWQGTGTTQSGTRVDLSKALSERGNVRSKPDLHRRLGLLVTVIFTTASAVMWAAYNHPILATVFGIGAILETWLAVRDWKKRGA